MKLRNKKTGEVIILIDHTFDNYNSLAEVMKEWEDYKPAEPLIEDPKIRKAVRAWAEADGVTKVYAYAIGGGEYTELYAQDNGVTDGRIRMSIKTQAGVDWGDEYAIEELCGEEEE
jgi:hypothetical protein